MVNGQCVKVNTTLLFDLVVFKTEIYFSVIFHLLFSVQQAVQNQTCMFGTVDTWLLWNLTGGLNKGVHCTDVTNASRTM